MVTLSAISIYDENPLFKSIKSLNKNMSALTKLSRFFNYSNNSNNSRDHESCDGSIKLLGDIGRNEDNDLMT